MRKLDIPDNFKELFYIYAQEIIFLNCSKISNQILRRPRSPWKGGCRHLGFWTQVISNDALDAATLPKVYLAPHSLEMHKERVPALSVPYTSFPLQHCCLSIKWHSAVCASTQPISTGFSVGSRLSICHADDPWIAGENDAGERQHGVAVRFCVT